jgi:TIR domain
MAREAVFLSYRRDDTADVCGRMYDALGKAFGKGRLFRDVSSLRPGADFGDAITGILPKCRATLVLIGPHWLSARDESGNRRLDDPNDWVRAEIEMALNAPDLYVVPVLVNGARMPRAEELPSSLHALLRRHAAVIRRDPDFHGDVARLTQALRASVQTGILDLAELGGELKQAAVNLANSPQAGQAVKAARSGLFSLGKLAAIFGVVAFLAVIALVAVGGFAAWSLWPQEWTDIIASWLPGQ